MKRMISALFMLLIFSQAGASAEALAGRIVYFDGEIEVHQEGDLLDNGDIKPGYELRQNALVKTGTGSFAEIEISGQGSSPAISIKMESNTSFYYKTAGLNSGKDASVSLLGGSILVRVKKMLFQGQVVVASRSTQLGVRGTEFTVTTAPEGSVLVTCPEGRVACTLATGEEVVAEEGMVVEILQGRQIRGIEVGNDRLDFYKNEWFAERVRIFRAGAFSITKPLILDYEEYAEKFNLYYRELKDNEKILMKYEAGREKPDDGTLFADKIKVSPAVFNMRSIFYIYEELFYRIDEIKRYHDIMPVKGVLRKKYEINDFMKDFEKNYKANVKKAAHTRQLLGLYAGMEKSESSSSSILQEILGSSPLAE